MVRSVILITLLSVIVGVSYFVNFPSPLNNELARVIESGCSLSQGACEVLIDPDFNLKFDLQPKPLPVMEPFLLAVTGLGGGLSLYKAWFEGRDMSMGQHFLFPTEEHARGASGLFSLRGMIPICHIDSSMVWRLVIEIRYKEELIQIHFEQNASIE